jgi:hypothetical protein
MNKKILVICTIIVLLIFVTGCTINNYYMDQNKTKKLKGDSASDDTGTDTTLQSISQDQNNIYNKGSITQALNF